MSLPEGFKPSEVGEVSLDTENARAVMNVIDKVINDVYLPFRGAEGYGTERAVLVAEPHVPHRENNAEHSWHVAYTGRVLYDNRDDLGISFPEDFDIGTATQYAVDHDVLEIWYGDVNAMTKDPNLIALKAERERTACQNVKMKHPAMTSVAIRWEEYERKDSVEAKYVSDIDKILATRIIFLDNGRKWHEWDGEPTSREQMSRVVRGKLLTGFGHQLFDVIEEDVAGNPWVFPVDEERDDVHVQLRMC